jgi:hypothetical protein
MSTKYRLCEFANVRNRAAQFFVLMEISIALKRTFANRHYRHETEDHADCGDGLFLGLRRLWRFPEKADG